MRRLAILLLLPLAGCARAQADDACAGLTQTAIGAALDDPRDTYNLAVAFYTGRCVDRDYSNAARLWERASDAGVVSAKNNLGYLLSEGLGVEQDRTRAAALWLEAAQANHAEAQVHLGNALFDGEGLAQDRVRGLAWVLHAEQAARTAQDIGGGPAIVSMAEDEKHRMLGLAPGLEPQAQALVGSLDVDGQR